MKTISTTIMMALLIVSLCFLGVVIKDADAQITVITILPDGTVDPPSGIQRNGDTYTLTDDLILPIEIKRDNIILNGANHTLQGPGAYNEAAISLKASNVTITNCHITSWAAGIYGAFNNNTITANKFTNNDRAIALYATNYIISKNILQQNSQGIYIKTDALTPIGDNNLIINNQITGSSYTAFNIINSDGTTITQNNITNNHIILVLGNRIRTNTAGQHWIYLNNFVDNTQVLQIHAAPQPGMATRPPMVPAGTWDNGAKGNYWSDYTTKYPNASERYNSDIGDTAYFIKFVFGTDIWGGEGEDHYPLSHAYDIPNDMGPQDPASSNPSPTPPIATTPKNLIDIPIEYILATILTLIIIITITLTARYKRKQHITPAKSNILSGL